MPVRSIRSLAFEDLAVGLSELVLKTVTEPRGRGGMLDEDQARTLVEVSDLLDAVFMSVLRAWDEERPRVRDAGRRVLQ